MARIPIVATFPAGCDSMTTGTRRLSANTTASPIRRMSTSVRMTGGSLAERLRKQTSIGTYSRSHLFRASVAFLQMGAKALQAVAHKLNFDSGSRRSLHGFECDEVLGVGLPRRPRGRARPLPQDPPCHQRVESTLSRRGGRRCK